MFLNVILESIFEFWLVFIIFISFVFVENICCLFIIFLKEVVVYDVYFVRDFFIIIRRVNWKDGSCFLNWSRWFFRRFKGVRLSGRLRIFLVFFIEILSGYSILFNFLGNRNGFLCWGVDWSWIFFGFFWRWRLIVVRWDCFYRFN